jgi:hypothetical protein
VAVRKIKADAKLEEFAVQSTAVHKASRPPNLRISKLSLRTTNQWLPANELPS